jgi:VanZ family protein
MDRPELVPSPVADPAVRVRPSWTAHWRWGVVCAYAGAIFSGSAQSTLPSVVEHVWDKLLHSGAYAVMSVLVVWALTSGEWRRVTWRTVALATLICSAYGWSDEFHQLFVPQRSYDLKDLLADATGAAAAAVVAWAWGILLRGRDRSHGV